MVDYRSLLNGFQGATEETPFGPEALVYKVGGKMFAILTADETPQRLSLKGPPERNRELRALYPAITPGYYLNKTHWNTIAIDGTVEELLVRELIDESYALIVASLPKKLRPIRA
jgi:predicted DNA-binding protein (MmcQ/YjbR family)